MVYAAPAPFRGMFTAAIPSAFTLPIAGLNGLQPDEISPEDWAFITAAYDEEIAYVDAQMGVLRDGLAPGAYWTRA